MKSGVTGSIPINPPHGDYALRWIASGLPTDQQLAFWHRAAGPRIELSIQGFALNSGVGYITVSMETVSHYRILRQIGSGGMGVVYLAEDTRLGCKVALKFLPHGMPHDPAAIERFQREARAASALNHPNICTLHDIGEHEGRPFLVMEFLEGATLQQTIAGKPMPLESLLHVGTQIANALEAAHACGIIHRDIKTSNVFLTSSGDAKIMDFGLAKQVGGVRRGEAAPSELSDGTVTISQDELTSPGTAVGTVAYMSPEQARGEALDARTDLFSLGAVLYEMATGRQAFSGKTTAVTFNQILTCAPVPATRLNPGLPPRLEDIINRLLEKDRDLRYQSAADLLADWKRVRRGLTSDRSIPAPSTAAEPAAPPPRRTAAAPSKGVVAGLTLAALAGLAYATYRLAGPHPSTPFQVMKVMRLTSSGKVREAAISPDGKYAAYVQEDAGQQSLWMRQVATEGNVRIVPANGQPFSGLTFSPDGNFIYYVRHEEELVDAQSLYRVPVLGGAIRKLGFDVDSPVAISPGGAQFAFIRIDGGQSLLMRADADGSNFRTIASRPVPGFLPLRGGPAWSPDGKRIAAGASIPGAGDAPIIVAVDGGAQQPLQGHWETVGRMAWTPDGSSLIVAASDQDSLNTQIWQVSFRSGIPRRITNDTGKYADVSLTADGSSLLTVLTDTKAGIWVAPAGNLTGATPVNGNPAGDAGRNGVGWTVDGKILYVTSSSGKYELWVRRAPRLHSHAARQ
jgi:serine/threonine protein kinase/Tol biopolymer transport system component